MLILQSRPPPPSSQAVQAAVVATDNPRAGAEAAAQADSVSQAPAQAGSAISYTDLIDY